MQRTDQKVLVVDDEPSMREYLDVLLTRAGFQVSCAGSFSEFKAALDATGADVVISDYRLGAESGMDVLKHARAHPDCPEVIIITAFGTPSAAVAAMRQGAYDYIGKPFDNDEMVLLVERALDKHRLAHENRTLRASLSPAATWLVGTSPAMREVWKIVDKVASTRATVLISGESGTGKEVIARAIHQRSPRAAAPFVPVNCGAIAEGVLESELFGHVRGAFTGATGEHEGILVTAGDGTVLLDEVGELPLGTQVKLLRVLQERTVKPVGSSKEVPFNARILAATNRRLEEEVSAGRFRQDLYFRLNVVSIDVPPLRARSDDIPALARYFLRRFAVELGKPGLGFTPEALALLCRFQFLGNVRQLQNIVERAATLADGEVLGPESLPAGLRGEVEDPRATAVSLPDGFSLDRHIDAIERQHLVEALRVAGGTKMKAAQLLGLSFRSFRYRLAKHGFGDESERA
jgi:two-component system response regulator PilR (NtrC family)